MVDQNVVVTVRKYLDLLRGRGMDPCFAVVFGSQARGDARASSDIDLLVVSPEFDGQYDRERVGMLWVLAAQADARIEPVPCGTVQWREDDASAVIEMARREGEVVTITEDA